MKHITVITLTIILVISAVQIANTGKQAITSIQSERIETLNQIMGE